MKALRQIKIWHAIFLLAAVTATSGKAQEISVEGHVELANSQTGKNEANASNVVVWLVPATKFPDPTRATNLPRTQKLRLIQKDKAFRPHLLVIEVGTSVEFPNQDPFFHNVFSLFDGKRFDLGLYEAGTTHSVKFDRPGICYIFCNIHPEMSAAVVVLNTPYFAVSDRAGNLVVPGVPPGRYLLRVWHERATQEALDSVSREVTISENDRQLSVIRILETDALNLTHKNKYGQDYVPPSPSSAGYPRP